MKNILSKLWNIELSKDRTHKIFTICGLKIKKAVELNDVLEKDIIARSPFWDAAWYIKRYGYDFTKIEALNHWYYHGWKNGENPSRYINLAYCKKLCRNVNPILAYHSAEFAFFPDDKNNFKSADDPKRVEEYLAFKKTRKADAVVYTCSTNNYDDLHEIAIYKYIDFNYDYVCFSDDEELLKLGQLGIWEVRPLVFDGLDNTKNQRWHKINPHRLFPEYESSIWLDANINILSSTLFDWIKSTSSNILVPEHFKNVCIFQEYADVMKRHLDDIGVIEAEKVFIENDGMPAMYGLAETNILYRKHHDPQIVSVMDKWWELLNRYSKRDQLSFTYVLWKHGIKPEDIYIGNTRINVLDFYLFDHKKQGKKAL